MVWVSLQMGHRMTVMVSILVFLCVNCLGWFDTIWIPIVPFFLPVSCGFGKGIIHEVMYGFFFIGLGGLLPTFADGVYEYENTEDTDKV